jgi:lipopolysaccharide transport protein LptA
MTITRTILLGAAVAASVWAQTNVAPPAGMTLGAANEPTTITCQRWKFEYARNIVYFEGDVLAVNPRATLRSDFMWVMLDQSRSISNVIADGRVVITTPGNEKATGGHAEYTIATHKLVLTQEPKVNARGTLWTGERITFLIQSNGIQDVEVETGQASTNRSQLIIYPEATKKKTE